MSKTLDSLVFILGRLNKLKDEERIRFEGTTVFEEARQETITAIAQYEELAATPAPIVYNVVTDAQLAAALAPIEGRIIGKVETEAEQTSLDVLSAVEGCRGEVLAAIRAPA